MDSARLHVSAILLGITLLLVAGTVLAQQPKGDLGKKEYALHCAVCHGLTGKGDGSYNQTRMRPTDLTGLTNANKGVFPYQRIWEIIDGRQEIEAHGTRDMPIWGTYYRAIDSADRSGSYDPEPYVRTRIKALIDYIHRLQTK